MWQRELTGVLHDNGHTTSHYPLLLFTCHFNDLYNISTADSLLYDLFETLTLRRQYTNYLYANIRTSRRFTNEASIVQTV